MRIFLPAVALQVLLLVSAAVAAASNPPAANSQRTTQKEPRVYSSRIVFFEATPYAIEACKDGLMGALSSALGTTVDELNTAMGMLMPKSTGAKSNVPSVLLGSKRHLLDDQFSSVGLDDGELDYITKITQQASAKNVSASRTQELIEFAKSDLRLMRPVAERTDALLGIVVGGLFLHQLAAEDRSILVGDQTTEGGSRRLMDTEDMPYPPADRLLLEQPLIHLGSPTFTMFLSQLFGVSSAGLTLAGVSYEAAHRNIVESFCKASELATQVEPSPTAHLCPLMNIVAGVLGCRDDDVFNHEKTCGDDKMQGKIYLPAECKPQHGPMAGKTFDPTEYTPDFDFEDLRQRSDPPMLPLTIGKDTVDKEGLEHYLLFRAAQVAGSYTATTYQCGKKVFHESIIPGYEVTHVLSYKPESLKVAAASVFKDIVLTVVAQAEDKIKKNPCKLVVTTRGTSNQFEWGIDLHMELVAFIKNGAQVHAGLYHLSNTILPALMKAFSDIDAEYKCNGKLEIIYTGHSLGGGVSQILSVLTADQLPTAKVHSVAFASPNVFNAEGVRLYRTLVNGRNFAADLDAVGSMPCATDLYPHGHYQCNGIVENGGGWALYHTNAGLHMFPFSEVADNWGISDSFFNIKIVPIGITMKFPASLQLGNSHICSYACKFSKYCTGGDPAGAWMCTSCPFQFPDQNLGISM